MKDKVLFGIVAAIVIVVAMGAVATLVMQDSDTGNVLTEKVLESVVTEEMTPPMPTVKPLLLETSVGFISVINISCETYYVDEQSEGYYCKVLLRNDGKTEIKIPFLEIRIKHKEDDYGILKEEYYELGYEYSTKGHSAVIILPGETRKFSVRGVSMTGIIDWQGLHSKKGTELDSYLEIVIYSEENYYEMLLEGKAQDVRVEHILSIPIKDI